MFENPTSYKIVVARLESNDTESIKNVKHHSGSRKKESYNLLSSVIDHRVPKRGDP
jgi:hypothetical protein